MVRASALQSVDWDSFPKSSSYQKTLKMVFTASLLGAQQNRNSVENKPASLLVVPLGKTLIWMPPSLSDRQVVGPNNLPIVVAPV